MGNRLRASAIVVGLIAGLIAPAIAVAATPTPTGSFAHRVPRTGSSTDNAEFTTSTSHDHIHLRFTTIPYDTDVKPIRCDNLADISGYKRYAAGNTSWSIIASNVITGTCYRLNLAAPTFNYFDVQGYVAD